MADETLDSGVTVDQTTTGSAPVPDAGSTAPAAATPRRSMADIGAGIIADTLKNDRTEPAAPAPRRPAAPRLNTGVDPAGDGPGDETDAADPATLLADFGIDLELPPEIAAPLVEKLTEVRAWQENATQWVAQQEQRLAQVDQQLTQQVAQAKQIFSQPIFQQALAIAKSLQAGGPGAAGGREPEFETETERQLWQRGEQMRVAYGAELAAVRAELQELRAGHESMTETQTQVYTAQNMRDIKAAHATLDKQFPELAGDAKARKQWHAEAAALMESNPSMDLTEALDKAGRILSFDHASKRGAANALSTARKAAKSSTLRDPSGAIEPSRTAAGGRKSIRDIGLEMAEKAGIAV